MTRHLPQTLCRGDTVAVLSPSAGVPALFSHTFDAGLDALRSLGLNVKEFPTARMANDYLRAHPEVRARDLNDAFRDDSVNAIITSIGGNDAVRILPFLDPDAVKQNPKIFMGFSDASAIHTYLTFHGVVSYYGPAVMAGLAQMQSLPAAFREHVATMLLDSASAYEYQAYDYYCDGYPDWSDPANTGLTNTLKENDGWHWLQGESVVSGRLYGGCVEVLDMLKATKWWPDVSF